MSQIGRLNDAKGDHPVAATAEGWRDATQLVLLIVAFIGGFVIRQPLASQGWPGDWAPVLMAVGMLCLGFGAGVLLYRRRQSLSDEELRKDFAEMSERTSALSSEMQRLETKQKLGS